MPPNLKNEVTDVLSSFFLREGFIVTSCIYDEACFGNETVYAESPLIEIKFETDRGDLYVSVRPMHKKRSGWVLLDTILKVSDIIVPPQMHSDVPKRLRVMGPLLENHFGVIARALSPERLAATSEKVRQSEKEIIEAARSRAAEKGK